MFDRSWVQGSGYLNRRPLSGSGFIGASVAFWVWVVPFTV